MFIQTKTYTTKTNLKAKMWHLQCQNNENNKKVTMILVQGTNMSIKITSAFYLFYHSSVTCFFSYLENVFYVLKFWILHIIDINVMKPSKSTRPLNFLKEAVVII